ncbi:MAG TPA: hypothetical protein VH572_09585 [Gaiella sp.]
MLEPTALELRRLMVTERHAALRADFHPARPGALRRRVGAFLVAIGLRLAQQPVHPAGADVEEAPADAGASSLHCAA